MYNEITHHKNSKKKRKKALRGEEGNRSETRRGILAYPLRLQCFMLAFAIYL